MPVELTFMGVDGVSFGVECKCLCVTDSARFSLLCRETIASLVSSTSVPLGFQVIPLVYLLRSVAACAVADMCAQPVVPG